MTQNKKATYGEAMEQKAYLNKALVSNTIIQPRKIDIVRMLHVFQSNKNSYNSYTISNRSHKQLNQKLIEFFKGNLSNQLGDSARTLPIDQRTGYNGEHHYASNLACTSGLIWETTLNQELRSCHSLDIWRNYKKVSFNNKKYLFLQAFLDKYGKPAFYKIATPFHGVSHGDSDSTLQRDEVSHKNSNSARQFDIDHNNSLAHSAVKPASNLLLDSQNCEAILGVQQSWHIPNRPFLNSKSGISSLRDNRISFNNFFPYKQSFLCYWLIPFIGIIACLPTTSQNGLSRSNYANENGTLATINNSTFFDLGRIEDQNLSKNFDLRLQLSENSLKKLGSIYINKLFQLLQTNPKEITEFPISISSNNGTLNKDNGVSHAGFAALHASFDAAGLKSGSDPTYFNALVSENVLTQNIFQKSSFHWYWHNPFYTFYKKPYNQNNGVSQKLSHFSRKLLPTFAFGKSCLMPAKKSFNFYVAKQHDHSYANSPFGIQNHDATMLVDNTLIKHFVLKNKRAARISYYGGAISDGVYHGVSQIPQEIQAISHNPITSYKLALFLMDNMMANKCLLWRTSFPKNTFMPALPDCVAWGSAKYSLESMPHSLNAMIPKPLKSATKKPVRLKKESIKRACLNGQDSTWVLFNMPQTNIIPNIDGKAGMSYTNSGHLWNMKTFTSEGEFHKTFLDSNKCFGITDPNILQNREAILGVQQSWHIPNSVIYGLPYKTLNGVWQSHTKSDFYLNLLDSFLKKSDSNVLNAARLQNEAKPSAAEKSQDLDYSPHSTREVSPILKINHPILTSDSFFTKKSIKQKAKKGTGLLNSVRNLPIYQGKSIEESINEKIDAAQELRSCHSYSLYFKDKTLTKEAKIQPLVNPKTLTRHLQKSGTLRSVASPIKDTESLNTWQSKISYLLKYVNYLALKSGNFLAKNAKYSVFPWEIENVLAKSTLKRLDTPLNSISGGSQSWHKPFILVNSALQKSPVFSSNFMEKYVKPNNILSKNYGVSQKLFKKEMWSTPSYKMFANSAKSSKLQSNYAGKAGISDYGVSHKNHLKVKSLPVIARSAAKPAKKIILKQIKTPSGLYQYKRKALINTKMSKVYGWKTALDINHASKNSFFYKNYSKSSNFWLKHKKFRAKISKDFALNNSFLAFQEWFWEDLIPSGYPMTSPKRERLGDPHYKTQRTKEGISGRENSISYDLTENYTMLSEKIGKQKKRRARKERMEIKRQKKRKRFHPRPIWLRFRTGIHFRIKPLLKPYILKSSLNTLYSPLNLRDKNVNGTFINHSVLTNKSTVRSPYYVRSLGDSVLVSQIRQGISQMEYTPSIKCYNFNKPFSLNNPYFYEKTKKSRLNKMTKNLNKTQLNSYLTRIQPYLNKLEKQQKNSILFEMFNHAYNALTGALRNNPKGIIVYSSGINQDSYSSQFNTNIVSQRHAVRQSWHKWNYGTKSVALMPKFTNGAIKGIGNSVDNLKYSLDFSLKFSPWLRYKRANNLFNYNAILDYRIKNLSLNMKKVLDRSTLKNNANYIAFMTEPRSAYDQYILKLKDKKRGPKHIWAWFYKNISKIDGYTSLGDSVNMNKTLWHFFPGDKAPPWYKIRPYNEIINNNSKQRIDWALKKTNIWALNKFTKRDRLWQLTKKRRQAKLNNIKYRARKRDLFNDALFSGDLKLQNKLNKITLATDIPGKWHAMYQNNGLMRKRANYAQSVPISQGYNVNIFQKIRQKEEKLNLLISSKSIKTLSKKNLKKSSFIRKAKYFWWSNNWPNSFKNNSKNVWDISYQGFKPFYYPEGMIDHNVISCNGADMPHNMMGNWYTPYILNTNVLLSISILLIHFCALISFISISQIRYLIKAHFIFLSKLSKRYIDIVHSVLGLFKQLNSEFNLITNDFKSLMLPNLNKSLLSNKRNISIAKWDTPLSSKHLASVKRYYVATPHDGVLQDVKYSKFTLNLIKREFNLTKNGTLKPKGFSSTWYTSSSVLPFWGGKSIKTESLAFSKKPIKHSLLNNKSTVHNPYYVRSLGDSVPVYHGVSQIPQGINGRLGYSTAIHTKWWRLCWLCRTTLKQLYRKNLTQLGVSLEFLVTMPIFLIKGALNPKTSIAITSNKVKLSLKSFAVNLLSTKFNTSETFKNLFYRGKLGFYLFSLYILNYLEKYIVMFALCLESGFNPIVEYFKYAEENSLSLLSDMFLLEWTADLTDLIPEKICLDLWTSFSRFSRGTKSIFLGLGLGPIAFINAFTLNVFERRLLCLFDTVIEILGQPDTELMIREKKGSIVWDVWAEFLMKISDNYNINVEALSMGVLDEPGVYQEEFPLLQEEQKRAVDLLCNDDISILGLKEHSFGMDGTKQHNMWFARKWQSRFSNTVWDTSLTPFLSFRAAWDMATPYKNGIQIAKPTKTYPKGMVSQRYGVQQSWHTPEYTNSIEKQGTNDTVAMNMNFLEFLTFSKPDGWTGHGLVLNNANWTNWSVSQFLTYQGEDTDLIIDLNPPKSFTHISSIKHLKELYQPLGTLVCQIYSGILSKQTAKNVLVIGGSGNDKTLLIQALAGETELKIITDNANRYGLIERGVAVGIKLLRDVFDSVALHAPCLFLLEDIHVIGQRRPLLESDDEKAKGTEINFGVQREEVNEKNLVIYKLNKNAITHYQKPYKGDYSFLIPTNNFSFDLFLKSSPARIRGTSSTFRFPMENVYKTNSGEHLQDDGMMEVENNETMQSNLENGLIRQSNKKSLKQKNAILPSFLQVPPDQLFAPPATSPFTILVLKEQKKLKVKTVVKELPLTGLPGEQFSLVPKISYSIRVKVFVLADLALSNLSAKLDMITDLLLILDSVRSNRGFVVFATTHSPYLLDPALRRPGRLDETICLASVANINSRWEIVKSIKSSLSVNNKRHALAGLCPGHVPNRTFDLIDYVNLTSLDLTNGSALVNQQFQYTSFLLINKKWKTPWKTPSSNSGICRTIYQRDKLFKNKTLSYAYDVAIDQGIKSNIQIKTNNHLVKMKTTKTIKATAYFQIGKKLINIKLGYNLNSYSPIYNNNITNNANLAATDSNANVPNLAKELQYVTFYSKQNILKQNLLRLFSGKVSEAFAFSNTNLKTEGFKNLNLLAPLKKTYKHAYEVYNAMTHLSTFDPNVKMPSAWSAGLNNYGGVISQVPQSSGQLNSLYTTQGIDQTWRSGTSLIYSLIQKRYLYNKNMIVPKLIQFSNGSSPQEPPSPPYSNLLIPAKRFENYKRTLRHSIERKAAFSIQDKIQFHQQQRVIRRLYRLPVKESFRSEIMQSAYGGAIPQVNQNSNICQQSRTSSNNAKSISFSNASMVLGPLEKSVHKPTSVNWYYRNRILMRHRYYLNNQWWNGQLDEHNLETIFLSDIDWRYTFVESLGDILIDFPDSDQHYHPRQRRWMLNSGYWSSWFDFDKIVNQEIYSHFVLETFTKAYNLLDKNREILDYAAAKFIKSGMVKELHFVAGLKRFKIN